MTLSGAVVDKETGDLLGQVVEAAQRPQACSRLMHNALLIAACRCGARGV